ncbi:MAG: hypothetical protein ACKO3S_02285 [bacterium]
MSALHEGAHPRRRGLAAISPLDPWLVRLVKLVPSEAVAVYLAGRTYAHGDWAVAWPFVGLALTLVLRAWGTADERGPQWQAVAISGVSFVLWVCATGGTFAGVPLPQDVAALAVLVWTTVVPGVWRGSPHDM